MPIYSLKGHSLLLQGRSVELATRLIVVRQGGREEVDAPTDKWTSDNSTIGQRALHLQKYHKGWALLPPTGLQKNVAAAKQLRDNLVSLSLMHVLPAWKRCIPKPCEKFGTHSDPIGQAYK